MELLIQNADVVIWLALMVLFLIAEAATAALVSIWFVVGALGAIIIAAIGLPGWFQILVFLAVSGLVLLLAKPLMERAVNQKIIKTNADRLIGALAKVVEDISPLTAAGQVEVLGQRWSAISENDKPIQSETVVRIKDIQGVKLIVEEIEEVEN